MTFSADYNGVICLDGIASEAMFPPRKSLKSKDPASCHRLFTGRTHSILNEELIMLHISIVAKHSCKMDIV